MRIRIQFFSYFRDLAGCQGTDMDVPAATTLGELQERLMARFPNLAPMRRSALLAVGVAYEARDYILREGDEVSFFPPVQGG